MWDTRQKSLRFFARQASYQPLPTGIQVYAYFTAWWPYLLGGLAAVLIASGVDDLVPSLVCLWHSVRRRRKGPSLVCPALERMAEERRIAIFVPCWKESDVIANMVRHNLAAVRYRNYDFFLGVYPNDQATVMVVRQLTAAFRNVHMVECPHPGPTSKADCLNWVYRGMESFEKRTFRCASIPLSCTMPKT